MESWRAIAACHLWILAFAGCSDDGPRGIPWDPTEGTTGGASGSFPDDGSTGPFDDDDSGGPDDPAGPTGDEPGGTTTTDGVPADCSHEWQTPWIGSPCGSDADCTFDGGDCLLPVAGFPCGSCTLACDTLCPELDGTPATYCINGTDVGLAELGYCVSQCDEALIPGEGCRDGYVCDTLPRADGVGSAAVCIPEAFGDGDPDDPLVSVIDHAFLIEHFGGTVVDANDYGPDLDSFQMYLDDVGVQYFSAAELAEPYNQAAATMCGYSILLPERDEWEKAAALALFSDVLRELVGEPIFVRNWWRPPCYNDAVGGAAGGDHPDADAFDLDFASSTARAIAQGFLCDVYWKEDIVPPEDIDPTSGLDPVLNMSVGLGGISLHLGVLSDGGRRFWYYDSYTAEPESSDCW